MEMQLKMTALLNFFVSSFYFESFKKIFRENWTFCPFKFVALKDTFLYTRQSAYSFFIPQGVIATTTWSNNSVPQMTYHNTYFSMAFCGPWTESSAQEMTIIPEETDANITQHAFELALKRLYGTAVAAQEEQEAIGLFATALWLTRLSE